MTAIGLNDVRRHRWPAVALLCLTGAAALHLQAGHWRAQAEQVEAAAEMARKRNAALERRQLRIAAGAQKTEAGTALAALPPLREREARLIAFLAATREVQVRLENVDLMRETDALLPVERVRLHVPMRGNYAALRALIVRVLAEDPALSLDGVRLRRGSVNVADLDAELDLTLLAYTGAARSTTR